MIRSMSVVGGPGSAAGLSPVSSTIITPPQSVSNRSIMAREPLTPPRSDSAPRRGAASTFFAVILLSVVAAVCSSLGMWQLGRAAERDTLHAAIEQGRRQAPLQLSPASAPEQLVPWRSSVAYGQWSDAHTILLENRNLDGRPGYWVATPLLFRSPASVAPGPAGSTPTVNPAADGILVLRGWLPRDMQAAGSVPTVPRESGVVEVHGELQSHVPRIFELWQWAGGQSSALPDSFVATATSVPQVQNLNLAEYEHATGLRLLPAVLAQTDTPTAAPTRATLKREWAGPSLDSDQNRGYALQWFSFAAIAGVAALFLVRAMIRRRAIGKPASKEVQ